MATETTPIIPLEASSDGKRNAYTLFCEAIGRPNHYALCLHRLKNADGKALALVDRNCIKNLDTTACVAATMRGEELAKGRAIYFKERVRFTGLSALVDKAKELFMPTKAPVTQQNEKSLGNSPAPIGDDYMAAALNSAMKDHQAQIEKEQLGGERRSAVVNGPLHVLPGESMLEAAKRMLATRASQN
jgi:hypothetical protein